MSSIYQVTKGNLYEVFLWFYTGDTDAGGYRDKQLARLLEALHVNWDTFNTRLAVAQFIKHKILVSVQRLLRSLNCPHPHPDLLILILSLNSCRCVSTWC